MADPRHRQCIRLAGGVINEVPTPGRQRRTVRSEVPVLITDRSVEVNGREVGGGLHCVPGHGEVERSADLVPAGGQRNGHEGVGVDCAALGQREAFALTGSEPEAVSGREGVKVREGPIAVLAGAPAFQAPLVGIVGPVCVPQCFFDACVREGRHRDHLVGLLRKKRLCQGVRRRELVKRDGQMTRIAGSSDH